MDPMNPISLSLSPMAPPEVGGAAKKLRVIIMPFLATGHIIPMFELASLMASRPDVEATILLSAANADIIRPSLARSAALGRHVRLLIYPFPSTELDLAPGQENIASVPSSESWKFDKAASLIGDTVDPIICDERPDAIIADYHYWWALNTANHLAVPCLTFIVVGAFPQLVLGALQHADYGVDGPVVIPGLPGPAIEIPKSELPRWHMQPSEAPTHDEEFKQLSRKAIELKSMRFGVVVNTYYELEPEYCDVLRKSASVFYPRTWFVGPIAVAAADRDIVAVSGHSCISWLDEQKPGSVVYVCFGSWCHFSEEQLKELAVGLEASGRKFLWVVRDSCKWLPEGWEGRVEGKLVKGWAPQVEILSHVSVGAFLTHCGWNSVLEAAAAGVPMLTWPLVVEQFINERLVVEVMRAGARVWDGPRSTEESEKVVVSGEAIGGAVAAFMDTGGGGEAVRGRAREYAAKAKAAVAEGGSSTVDLHSLIDELMMEAGKKANPTQL